MLNELVKEIITKYSAPSAEGLIGWDSRIKLTPENFDIVKSAFDLSEHRLSHLDCAGHDCYEEVMVKRKSDGSRYVQCPDCKKLDFINEDQDLAYKITLDGLADFLIGLLEIEQNKKIIKSDEAIYLGKKEVKELGDLTMNFYLLRGDEARDAVIKHYKTNPKASAIIISLNPKKRAAEEAKISECWLCDMVFYDQNLSQFTINYKNFFESIKGCFAGLQKTMAQKWLDSLCLQWFKNLIKNKKINRGEKTKFQNLANDYFNVTPNKFNKIWQKEAPAYLKLQGAIKRA